jgi:hypothetical protein
MDAVNKSKADSPGEGEENNLGISNVLSNDVLKRPNHNRITSADSTMKKSIF